VRELGYVPFVPHLNLLWHFHRPHGSEYWLNYDLEWLAKCDVLLRLPGASVGADLEVEWCIKHRMPVVWSVPELVTKYLIPPF
jgi:hypothetical protein